jgi:phosphoribosylformimino-5-aminoimidazole carboxamide ribotide isomerase
VIFTIFPAIDLRQGRVVRLRQGDPAAQTTFADDPAAVAQGWAKQGAAWLHVVNLDGALDFSLAGVRAAPSGAGCGDSLPINLRRLADIRAAVSLPLQFGGGLRTIDDVARALGLGATRVVLGTVAVRQPEMVSAAVERFGPERIVVGIDARDGMVATHGWQETSSLAAVDVARRMADLGVLRVVYTDISRDGMLSGVNIAATLELARSSGLAVIASGGVASVEDIRGLAPLAADGIEGVIVGQALYTGALRLNEALAAIKATDTNG